MVRIDFVLAILSVCISLPAMASVFMYLDVFARSVAALCVIAALATVRSGKFLRGSLSTALSLTFFAYYGVHFSADNLISPAMNLLVVLLGIRLVSERTVRHHLQAFALSLIVLAGSSLFSLGPAFLAYLTLLLAMIGVALVVATFSAADPRLSLARRQLKRVVGVALLIPAGTVPLMGFFFVVMPRSPYPLWNLPRQGGMHATGMSESVRPGSTPNVAEVRAPVFRAAVPEMDRPDLYWRGIVLNSFSDNTWRRERPPEAEEPIPGKGRPVVRCTILPEPLSGAYLVTLDHPVSVTGLRVRGDADLVYSLRTPTQRRVKYEVSSVRGGEFKVAGRIDRPFYLRVPKDISARIRRLGEEIGAGKDAADKIARAERYYRTTRFRYSSKGLPTGPEALETFLFDQRVGHCELFASSLGVLLRVAGVPCRLVGGYYGGLYNGMGGYYVVTEDAAHLWVEAFVEGRGWVRVDPSSWATGFVREERKSTGLLPRLEMWLDAATYAWNVAVINYDLESQVRLFNAAGDRLFRVDLRIARRTAVVAAVAAAILFGAAAILGRHGRTRREERLVEKFLHALRVRHGVERGPAEGLHDLTLRVGSQTVTDFVLAYGDIVYRDRPMTGDDYRRLKLMIREIKRG